MMPDELSQDSETPLEHAARIEAQQQTASGQDAQDEREADALVADIDAYVAETDPASLPQAEEELNAWEIPTAASAEGIGQDETLESVFAAGTEAEAAIVRGLLESQGIPTTLDGLPTRTLGNIFQAGEDRWGDILVPASQAGEARAVIAAAQSSAAETQERPSTLEGEGQGA